MRKTIAALAILAAILVPTTYAAGPDIWAAINENTHQNLVQRCQIAKLRVRVAILERGTTDRLVHRLRLLESNFGVCAGRGYSD